MRRRWRWLLAVMAAAPVAMLVLPGVASAAPAVTGSPQIAAFSLPCPFKELDPRYISTCLGGHNPATPTPHMPGDGLAGQLDPSPAAGTSKYAVYGYAPLHWSTYDEPSFVSDPGGATAATTDTMFGNALFGAAVDLTAFANGLGRAIDPPTFLYALDDLVNQLAHALYRSVWVPFIGLALGVVGLGIIAGRRGQDHAGAVRLAGHAVAVIALVGYVLVSAGTLGPSVARTVSSVNDDVTASIAGQTTATSSAAGAFEVDDILYPEWLEGLLGSATSKTAVTYGPKFYDASGYTWKETANGSQAPSAAVQHAKSVEWTEAAKDVKATDPAAYDHLTDANQGRTSAGFIALLAAVFTVGFRLVAYFIVLAALLQLLLAVIFTPVVGVIAVNAHASELLRDLLRKVGAGLGAAVIFNAAAAINIRVDSTVLAVFDQGVYVHGAKLPVEIGLAVCALLAGTLWYYLRPYRRLTSIIGATTAPAATVWNSRRRDRRREGRFAETVAAGLGAAVGGAAGAEIAAGAVERRQERAEGRKAEPVETSTPAGPRAEPADGWESVGRYEGRDGPFSETAVPPETRPAEPAADGWKTVGRYEGRDSPAPEPAGPAGEKEKEEVA